MQKLHHLKGLIARPEISLASFLGWSIGFTVAFRFGAPLMVLSLLTAAVLLFLFFQKGKAAFLVFLGFLIFGFALGMLRTHWPSPNGKGEIRGMVIASKNNYYLIATGWRRYYVYEKNCTREVGDILRLQGTFSPYVGKEYESRFSFMTYLEENGVKQAIQVKETEVLFLRPFRFREQELRFLSSFDSLTSGLIDSVVFGRKDYQNEAIALSASLGVLSYLSASGILYGGFLRFLEAKLSKRWGKPKSALITFVFACLLLPFLYGKIGVYRIFLLRFFTLIFLLLKREPPTYLTLLGWSGIVVLFLHPFAPVSSSFRFGFGISLFLTFSRSITARGKKKQQKILSFLLLQLLLFPLYNQRGEWHLLLPLYATILLPVSYGFAILSLLSFCTLPWVRVLSLCASGIWRLLQGIKTIDVTLPLGEFSPWFTFGYYALLTIGVFAKQIGFMKTRRIAHGLQITFLLIHSLPVGVSFLQEVTFINVGQGDAILIRDGYTNVLLDTGGNLSFDMATEVDIPFFRKEKVYQIDCLIASHGDFDHIGAKDSLIQNFRVKRFVSSATEFPLKVGNLTFTNYNVYGGTGENDQSLVLGFTFMGCEWLMMGDAPKAIEHRIVQDNPSLRCDVLKAGHHGSKTSSSQEFLLHVQPKMAIISVGRNNTYGHPDKEVLSRFESLRIPYRRTDEEGSISYRRYFGLPLRDFS